jgi:hypothetical protein
MQAFWSLRLVAVVLLIQAVHPAPACGGNTDNALSTEETKDGWISLFDGKRLGGRQTSND